MAEKEFNLTDVEQILGIKGRGSDQNRRINIRKTLDNMSEPQRNQVRQVLGIKANPKTIRTGEGQGIRSFAKDTFKPRTRLELQQNLRRKAELALRQTADKDAARTAAEITNPELTQQLIRSRGEREARVDQAKLDILQSDVDATQKPKSRVTNFMQNSALAGLVGLGGERTVEETQPQTVGETAEKLMSPPPTPPDPTEVPRVQRITEEAERSIEFVRSSNISEEDKRTAIAQINERLTNIINKEV